MDVFNMFSAASIQKSNDVEYSCPSCGNKCRDKDNVCSYCEYDLSEYKKTILAPYKYYNSAIVSANNNDYFTALIDATKYLAFYPNDYDANKLYVFLLHKNGHEDAYNKALDDFEDKFVRDPWIMDVETNGIDSYILPLPKCDNVDGNENAFSELTKEYVTHRTKTINEIIQFVAEFYDIVRAYKDKAGGQKLAKFYETNFYQFLSKKEINVVSHDGQNYDDLKKEEIETITIHSKVSDRKTARGTIVTYYPAVYLRHALVSKEIVAYVDNESFFPGEKIKNTKPNGVRKNNSKRRKR